MARPSWLRLALLGAVLCGLAAAAPARAQAEAGAGPSGLPRWSEPVSAELRLVGAALRAARKGDAPAPDVLAGRIAAAGPALVDPLIEVLVRRRVPETSPEDAAQVLSAPQRAIVLSALRALPVANVRRALAARLDGTQDDDVRLACVHALGAIGDQRDLGRLVALTPRRTGDAGQLTRDGREALRLACGSILGRDPRAWTSLPDVVRTADAGACRALLEAVGAQRNPLALPVLADAARTHAAIAPQAVALAAKCGRSADAEADRELVAWMVAELPAARPEYARSLLQAIGVVDTGPAAPTLIAALEHEDAGVRDSALWGLRRLSGYGFPETPAPWIAWYAQERRWQETERPACRAALRSNDVGKVTAALRAYAQRRAFQSELVAEVAPVLERREPGLRRLACETLEILGSSAALRPLAPLLQDEDATVAGAAQKALQALWGGELPCDPEVVLALLGPA